MTAQSKAVLLLIFVFTVLEHPDPFILRFYTKYASFLSQNPLLRVRLCLTLVSLPFSFSPLSLSLCPPGHLHRSRPHGSAWAPNESHQRRLQEVQGKRPVQEAGGHAGGTLPLTFKLSPTHSLPPPSSAPPFLSIAVWKRGGSSWLVCLPQREFWYILCMSCLAFPTLLSYM